MNAATATNTPTASTLASAVAAAQTFAAELKATGMATRIESIDTLDGRQIWISLKLVSVQAGSMASRRYLVGRDALPKATEIAAELKAEIAAELRATKRKIKSERAAT